MFASGCGSDGDAGPSPDGGVPLPAPVDCDPVALSWSHPWVALTPGVSRTVHLTFERDASCVDAQIVLTASEPGVLAFDTVVTVPLGHSRVAVPIAGEAEGNVTLTATWALTGEDVTASLEALVTDGALPACDGSAAGNVSPGGSLEVTSGSLQGARVTLPEGAGRDDEYSVAAFDGSIGCASDQVPEGYRALGPAVTVGPTHLRMPREIPVRVPFHPAQLPDGAHAGHIEVSYTGPGVPEPRVVPFSSLQVEGGPAETWLAFETRRLGTFQAVARAEGPTPRPREYTFQAITGVSMGAGGSALIGLANPEQFDFVAPMGGPVEWRYLLNYIRTYHLGGFCSEVERELDAATCEAGAHVDRTPESRWLHQHRQDFEHWHYIDEYDGQGGTFDRRQYIRIFRDLTRMYGNANTTHEGYPEGPNITPPGVDPERAFSPDEELCGEGAEQVVIPPCEGTFPDCGDDAQGNPTGYIDDEYNPQGQYPVITLCDGGEVRVDGVRDVGTWDPDGDHTMPVEVMLAVDINGNGRRDPGEPVIRSGREPFEDCGLDNLCNHEEPGYDPVTNPDPNGDDYDPLFNPMGTEGNGVRDSADGDPCSADGEVFDDVGLDGVAGTRQVGDGGFDVGEGNGCWDMAQGTEHMFASDPREMAMRMPEEVLRDVDIFTDGGIRDLFNFGVVHEHFVGGFVARGRNVRTYNGHAALLGGGADRFDLAYVPWEEMGNHVFVRYGDPDATETQKIQGDGGHVGTAQQLLDRVNATLGWVSSKWPDGDHDLTHENLCPGCLTAYTFDFEALGRTGPVGVVLPPGYYNPENQDRDYPILYFLHGYGQQPQDLVNIGFILRNNMSNPNLPRHARLQKMIIVFPDGRCRDDECIRGTFYADPPASHASSPPMESWVLALTEHMRNNYRVKEAATFDTTD
jgi:hypothetical protein